MKIVGFVGSPRVGGNSDLLVSKILEGAAGVGAEVEKIILNPLKISPCQGCDSCKKTLQCRINDDMQPLYGKILGADGIVLGAPIYFWSASAQMKGFIDRWYALDEKGVREKLAGKQVQWVCVFGDADPHVADGAVFMMRSTAKWFGMPFREPFLVSANEKGEVAHKPKIMEKALQLGIDLVL
jgi:multimeric flavodoxin WrbA